MKNLRLMALSAALLFCAACASNQPVLYPNAHSQSVGAAQASTDIAYCKRLAKAAGASPNRSNDAAGKTLRGGVGGAATGAVGGAIAGNAGRGAKIGAATGATAGLVHGLLGRPSPSRAYRNFVGRCLKDRGYELAGWN